MGFPKAPKQKPIAAAPRQSSLDIVRAQQEARGDLLRRRGYQQSQYAGETGMPSVLG